MSDDTNEIEWVDSHCHLDASGDAATIVARANDVSVARIVDVGTDLGTSRRAVENARRHPCVRATVGLHPHDASRFAGEWDALTELAHAPEVAAIGETGFDLYYRHSPQDAQEASFRHHIRLAHELGLPLVIHTRDAWALTFRVLAEEGVPAGTVFHCFTGGPEEAERALGLGACCSFSGIVSFGNAAEVRAAAALVPDDRVLVETDAPYLAPVPFRGKTNEPAFVRFVAGCLAEIRQQAPERIAEITTENFFNLFKKSRNPLNA